MEVLERPTNCIQGLSAAISLRKEPMLSAEKRDPKEGDAGISSTWFRQGDPNFVDSIPVNVIPKKVTPTLISVIPTWPPLVLSENLSGYRRISFSCRIRKFDGVRNRPCVFVIGRTSSLSIWIAGKSLPEVNKASQDQIWFGNMKLDHRRMTLISFCDATVLHDVDSNGFNRYRQSSG